jgi:hypothetical protein
MDDIAHTQLTKDIEYHEQQEYIARTNVNALCLGRTDTPLCKFYYLNGFRHGLNTPTCKGCPVAAEGHYQCRGTALRAAVHTMRSMVTQEDVDEKTGLLVAQLREHLRFLRGLAARGSETSR